MVFGTTFTSSLILKIPYFRHFLEGIWLLWKFGRRIRLPCRRFSESNWYNQWKNL